MFITAQRIALLAPGVNMALAQHLATALDEAMPKFGVSTPLARAHFMAQCCHESGGFRRFEENLNYSTPSRLDAMFSAVHGEADATALIRKGPEAIANRVYADRNGNGNEASGDGWRFRGRGLIQLTGRTNYAAASKGTGHDYVANPDLVAQPVDAVLTALWFFQRRGCIAPAERDDVEAVTRIINGPALAGLDDRREKTEKAKRIFI